MNAIQVIEQNFKWANNLAEDLGSSYLENPSVATALVAGASLAAVTVAFTARTTLNFLHRSVTQISAADIAGVVGFAVATSIALSLSPVVFVLASAFFTFNLFDFSQSAPEPKNETNTAAHFSYI